jgi:hypothetical protein
LLEEAVPETAEGEREVWQMCFLVQSIRNIVHGDGGTAMLGFSNSQVLKAHPEIADCESLHKGSQTGWTSHLCKCKQQPPLQSCLLVTNL